MTEKNLVYISVDKIFPHPANPRKNLGPLGELADSIKAKGVMQNLTVVPSSEGCYTVIIGHRRLAAAKLAGLEVVPCVITEMNEHDQLATMLLENMQRSDLTVSEQAQGFQMMIDFGETPESIAEKTGFSQSTVRRRLKMAELDMKTLSKVEERQISITDFDKLAQIDDIKQRNKVLESIGTNNFDYNFNSTLNKQEIAKRLPFVKQELKKLKCKKLDRNDTYSSKYTGLNSTIKIKELDTEKPLLTLKNGDPQEIFYYLDEGWGELSFYVKAPKPEKKKCPQKEIDREKYIDDTRKKLTALSEEFYKLRSQFIESLNVTSKNLPLILEGAVAVAAFSIISYISTDSNKVYDICDVDKNKAYEEKTQSVFNSIKSRGKSIYPSVIYFAFGDCATYTYFSGYSDCFPVYSKNLKLDMLYDWLISLGYEMSDEELQLCDGTHPLFVDKDANPSKKEHSNE